MNAYYFPRFLTLMPREKACRCYCADKHNGECNVRIEMGQYLHNCRDDNQSKEQNANENDLFRSNLFHYVSYVSLTTIAVAFLEKVFLWKLIQLFGGIDKFS